MRRLLARLRDLNEANRMINRMEEARTEVNFSQC